MRVVRFGFLGLTVLMSAPLISAPVNADVQAGLDALNGGDVALAASEFQQSFQDGDGDGAFYLGRLFEFGVGTETDLNRAANLYAAGAEAGSILSMNRLGLMYLEGKTLLRDYTEAANLFCQAADAGDQNGQLNCALMLQEGRGHPQDTARALGYFEAASAQGNVAAKNLLAQIYLNGDGVEPNKDRAIELFGETADQGNAMGLYELAKAHLVADADGAVDLVKAYSFLNLAAVRQHAEAVKLRDELEQQMTNEQITAAQAMARDWTAQRIAEQAAQPAGE